MQLLLEEQAVRQVCAAAATVQSHLESRERQFSRSQHAMQLFATYHNWFKKVWKIGPSVVSIIKHSAHHL
jgi:hypothetical protein